MVEKIEPTNPLMQDWIYTPEWDHMHAIYCYTFGHMITIMAIE